MGIGTTRLPAPTSPRRLRRFCNRSSKGANAQAGNSGVPSGRSFPRRHNNDFPEQLRASGDAVNVEHGRLSTAGRRWIVMALGLLGLKVGMTQVFDEQGKMAPVTVLNLGPCPVLQVRTPDRDGYHAVQLGFKDKLRRKAIRAERGHVAADFVSKRRRGLI